MVEYSFHDVLLAVCLISSFSPLNQMGKNKWNVGKERICLYFVNRIAGDVGELV